MPMPKYLKRVALRAKSDSSNLEQVIDDLLDYIDHALHQGRESKRWPSLATMAAQLPPRDLCTEVIVSVLVFTLPVWAEKWRVRWATTAREALEQRYDDPGRVERLLDGLQVPRPCEVPNA